MDNKVLDEAVEVACRERCPTWDGYAEFIKDAIRKEMRAALLAGVKVLLGEPVAWQYRFNHPLPNGGICEWHACDRAYADTLPRISYDVRPLYAPSLGEGDGR